MKVDVLQNFKKVISDPWPHIIIENALPEEVHNELRDSVPTEQVMKQRVRDHHGKRVYKAQEIISDGYPLSNILKEFMEYHLSREFFDKVFDIFEPWSKNAPIRKEQIKLVDRRRADNVSANCYTDFNFAFHPPENNVSNRTPHTDNEKEIYAGLLYLKHPEDKSTGGDFCIHKAGSLKMNKMREYASPGPIINSCPYKSNNFVMFWNGIDTQHSVSPRQGAEHPRWSINMIGRYTGTRNWIKPNL